MMFSRAMRRNSIKINGERGASIEQARGRLVFLSGCFVLVYAVLAVRAVDLTLVSGGARSQSYAMNAQVKTVPLILRADIKDRNGVMIATTLKTASLYADPKLISDREAAASALVEIFPDLTYGNVLETLQSKKRFAWVRRNITPNEQYAVLEIGEPGLDFRYENRRIYPHGELLAHIAGYTNVDNKGLAGVERSFNALLDEGKPLTLTIDVRLQHALKREIERAMDEFTAKGGMGVIMDAKNGEVLAGVSLPDFNPHQFDKAPANEMFNRLTLGVYELGSVFKIFSTAAFLETHNVPMGTVFDVREPIKRGRFTINDYHGENRLLTIPEVFMYSSNIGSAMMGESVGTKALRDFYSDLGLLDAMDIEIGEVARPLVPKPWGEVHTLTAAYGHGIATTLLQATSAIASVINGGTLVQPQLVLDQQQGHKPHSSLRVVSEDTSQKIRQMMRLVVTDGTGKKAEVQGYDVGGKTGTAEKSSARGYDSDRLISSFAAAFPIDDPQYVIFIAIDEPKGNKTSWNYATGGWVAAPAVARVITSMASILGIKPNHQHAANDNELKQYVSARTKK